MQKLAMEDQGSLFVQQLENGQCLCLSANASDTIEIIKGFIQVSPLLLEERGSSVQYKS